MQRMVYAFGGGTADGNAKMKELLGGKGANLAEMAKLGLPVPPGFTITTEVCNLYYAMKAKDSRQLPGLSAQADKALAKVEKIMGRKFGDPAFPLLLSVRSGARASMPGMMETVLNIGLTSRTIPGLIAKTGNPRFVWDAYRRLIMMYSDVVMEKAAGIEPAEGHGIRHQLEGLMQAMKAARGVEKDTDLSGADLEELCGQFVAKVAEVLGTAFPDDPVEQLWGGIGAVFKSWNGRRAVEYRRIEKLPDDWGTAVNVQAMVFGNLGDSSATGVGFTRDPATGRDIFYGEWLPNAQGEDVVAGIRTPLPVNEAGKTEHTAHLPSLETSMPEAYRELNRIQRALEKHYRDMLDIEFTVEDGRLWMLQCRVGKRNGVAAVKMAVDMAKERLIDRAEAVRRVKPEALIQTLLPMVDPAAERGVKPLAKGLPAGPGGAHGMVVFTADEAARRGKELKEKVILVRHETSPEDVHGMHAAQAILTAKGGMTSHAALVARGWGKCCIVGCSAVDIDAARRVMIVDGKEIREGDWITLNGTIGAVYEGQLPLVFPDLEHNEEAKLLLKWVDTFRRLGVRTNADTPKDSARGRAFGAAGIGLFRIEHMFYGEGSDQPLFLLRKMIASTTVEERRKALDELYPFMKKDIRDTLEVMHGLPVTVRLLDPPLHEFVPHDPQRLADLAASLGISLADLEKRAEGLRESNPMMGHRGVRLGITYPEVSEYQVRAILEATAELIQAGVKALPEIMVPVTSVDTELEDQARLVRRVHDEVAKKFGMRRIPHLYGTMIEIPRAALTANRIAEHTEFFSFGTNDLTQMTFGFSRDDIGGFLPHYLRDTGDDGAKKRPLLPADPFGTIDRDGVGELVRTGIERGRRTRPDLKIGICGEHGGDPESVWFCHEVGMDYVSCSPFRVPIARLAAAHAALAEAAAKAARRQAPAKKPAPKKPAPRKPALKKPAVKKPAPKKAPAKKAPAKKPARRKR